jgi:hypothetical protein
MTRINLVNTAAQQLVEPDATIAIHFNQVFHEQILLGGGGAIGRALQPVRIE